jgi:hypothetical protein
MKQHPVPYSYTALRKRADALHAQVLARMRALHVLAGLPPEEFPQASHRAAKDWLAGADKPNIDYDRVFRVIYLEQNRLYQPYHCLAFLVLKGRTDLAAIPSTATALDAKNALYRNPTQGGCPWLPSPCPVSNSSG